MQIPNVPLRFGETLEYLEKMAVFTTQKRAIQPFGPLVVCITRWWRDLLLSETP